MISHWEVCARMHDRWQIRVRVRVRKSAKGRSCRSRTGNKLQLALDKSRYVRLTERVRLDPGWHAPPEGAMQARLLERSAVHERSWVLVGARDAPGWWLRWHITLITSSTRSLAREARKATMYLGVKTERRTYKDKRFPMIWPMKGG